jgi:hypothetical protein
MAEIEDRMVVGFAMFEDRPTMFDPSPVFFGNVFEPGDYWRTVRGCGDCARHCCGSCPHAGVGGCALHLIDHGQNKPFACCPPPYPNTKSALCHLVWICESGSRVGSYRFASDDRGIFREALD